MEHDGVMPAAWRRHWRVGLAALWVKLALLAVLAWWWQGRAEGPAHRQAEGKAEGLAEAQAANRPVELKGGAPAAQASAAPAQTTPSSPSGGYGPGIAALRAAASERVPVELCGVGLVQVNRPAAGQSLSPDEKLPHLFEHALAAAWPQVLAALAQSPVERARAAGLALRAAGLPETENVDPRVYVRQLAQMATRSRDADIYQWAWTFCARAPDMPECRALSPQAWLERAHEDLRGWLLLARANPAERDSALRRAAQATAVAPLPALTPWVESAVPRGMALYLRLQLLIAVVGIEAAFTDSAYSFALTQCRERPEHRDTCSALADNLAQNGTDTMSLGVARALGRHAGWPPERIAAVDTLDQELARLALSEDASQTYTCSSVDRHTAWFRDRAALGERAALRQRVLAGGFSAPAAPSAASR